MNLRARYLNKTFTGVPFSLLNTTILAGGFDPYKVGVYSPDLVFDFENEFYRTNNRKTTFTNAITHSRTSNATMVDSDGLIKWAPHNLLTYSEEFDNAAWTGTSGGAGSVPVVTVNTATAPDGSATADKIVFETGDTASGSLSLIAQTTSSTDGVKHTGGLWLKGELGGEELVFRHAGNATFQKLTLTSNWVFYSQDEIAITASPTLAFGVRQQVSGLGILNTSATVYAWGAHLYRSDLGGMVSNPDTGNSYVPTTSSAVYLPRRGHHVYENGQWVNKGILHESEARTNLIPSSEDLTTQWGAIGGMSRSDGLNGFSLVTTDGTDASQFRHDSATINDGETVAGSFVIDAAQSDDGTNFYIYVGKPGSNRVWVLISISGNNLTLGNALEAGGGVNIFQEFEPEPLGEGLWRIAVSATNNLGTTVGFVVGIWETTNETKTIAVKRPQLEKGPTPSSYIPTSGSTVTRAAENLTIPAANLPYSSTAMSIAMEGEVTYADQNLVEELQLYRWRINNNDLIRALVSTASADEGQPLFQQVENSVNALVSGSASAYSPGINVPFSIASRHGSTFINGAVDGTALTEDTTPTALPDLSARDLELGETFMGTISRFRMWDVDLGDSGIEEASS